MKHNDSYDSRPISNGVKTAQDIYDEYLILPSLQMHQLRVAAVARSICENLTREVDAHTAIVACLFHDMGNIIKSDLALFPDFVEPEGQAHWELIKKDFIVRYGEEQHAANAAIGKEIGLSESIISMYNSSGFSRLDEILSDNRLELKIYQYADMRVGPHGVLSLDARIAEGAQRYRDHHLTRSEEASERLARYAHELEQQVFAEATIAPDDITEHSIAPIIGELREYTLA